MSLGHHSFLRLAIFRLLQFLFSSSLSIFLSIFLLLNVQCSIPLQFDGDSYRMMPVWWFSLEVQFLVAYYDDSATVTVFLFLLDLILGLVVQIYSMFLPHISMLLIWYRYFRSIVLAGFVEVCGVRSSAGDGLSTGVSMDKEATAPKTCSGLTSKYL